MTHATLRFVRSWQGRRQLAKVILVFSKINRGFVISGRNVPSQRKIIKVQIPNGERKKENGRRVPKSSTRVKVKVKVV